MTTSRDVENYRPLFERLRVLGEGPARDANFAIDYAEKDPETSALKARRVTEAILRAILPPDTKKLESLDFEEMRRLAARFVPKPVMLMVGTVQGLGNEGAHPRDELMDPAYAYHVVDALAGIVKWYLYDHLKLARPRPPTRWFLVGGLALVAGVASLAVLGVGGLWLVAQASPAQNPTTTTVTAAPPAPVVAVVEPVPQPLTTAPVVVYGVALWSRPPLPWETSDVQASTDGPGYGAPKQRCAGTSSDVSAFAMGGGWLGVHATCDGAPVTGWAKHSELAMVATPVPNGHSINQGLPKNLYYEANGLAGTGEWAEAVEKYDDLLVIVPAEPQVYERRGLARLRGGDPSGALEDLAVCLVLSPKSGPCRLYAAEAMRALGDPGWDQVLSDAVEYDPALAGEVNALRAPPARVADMRVLQGVGSRGVPLFDRTIPLSRVLEVVQDTPGEHRRELCRLYDNAPIEVLSTDMQWHRVRTRCDGREREGHLPVELNGRTLLPRQ
ncbi:MAG: hypothetical protein Q8P41_28545 [Pseudomonadota bacterium]|nr:hypothetical protein [Pseudomonadota bacterium]